MIEDLHDATLTAIRISWADGLVTVAAITAVAAIEITITGVTRVFIPRLMPWGPSSSINRVDLAEGASGIELEIEMQSGDMIQVTGEAIV